MTRRRTSVIGPARASAAAGAARTDRQANAARPTPTQTSATQLREWALLAVRELSLSAALDAQQEKAQLDAVRRRWRIAHGREVGNPADSNQRSDVHRLNANRSGNILWRKRFSGEQVGWQANETSVLKYLGEVDPSSHEGLRQHVAWLGNLGRQDDKASRLSEVLTLDAGPNLDMWQDFAPTSGVGSDLLPLPLFAQPLFLAALVRQALIALEVLARHGVVHNDLKPGNLCLALPAAFKPHKGRVEGQWDLRHLPLRLIDFEIAFAPRVVRSHHAGDNANTSAFVRACHAAAIGLDAQLADAGRLHGPAHVAASQSNHEQDIAACLAAIDWGADLWSLGFMLDELCQQALGFIKTYLQAFVDRWDGGGAEHLAAQRAVAALPAQIGWLRQFASRLQAQERDVAQAGQTRLATRTALPHRHLWGELETQFTTLGPSTPHSACNFKLIDPESPLAEETGPALWDRAAAQARWAAAAFTAGASSLGRRGAVLTRKSGGQALTLAALVALPVAAWSWRAEAANFALPISQRQAAMELKTYHLNGAATSRWLARTWLALADALQPGQADAITLATLAQAPQFDNAAPMDRAVLAAVRDSHLRALVQLADRPGVAQGSAEANAIAKRLLLAVYHADSRLASQRTGSDDAVQLPYPAPLGPGTDPAFTALARLVRLQPQQLPLAALLHAHLMACHGPAAGQQDIGPSLAALMALPAGTPSRADYLAFAEAVQARLNQGQPLCLLVPAAGA